MSFGHGKVLEFCDRNFMPTLLCDALNIIEIFLQESDLDASIVDTLAVREVCEKCHVTETEVHNALLAGDPQDQVSVT